MVGGSGEWVGGKHPRLGAVWTGVVRRPPCLQAVRVHQVAAHAHHQVTLDIVLRRTGSGCLCWCIR